MRVHLVRRRTYNPPGTPIGPFHRKMFHGRARRPGSKSPDLFPVDTVSPRLPNKAGLVLTLNMHYGVPAAFIPDSRMVIREDVADAIESALEGVELRQATVERAIDFPFPKGDRSIDKLDLGKSPFETRPDVLANVSVPKLFELVTWINVELEEQYPEAKLTKCVYDDMWEEAREELLAPGMFDGRSILWLRAGHALVPEVWERLKPFIDEDYFLTGHADIE